TGKWDLANNDLDVIYGAIPLSSDTMRGYIASAYAGGSWTGNGLTSSAAMAQASTSHKTALGYAQATDLFSSFPAVWNGTVVNVDSMLVRYTYSGDANLDGVVDTIDFNSLAAHFGMTGEHWSDGDFNYNGVIDTLDFQFLASNFGQTMPGAAVTAPASASPANVAAAVPEPGAAFLGLALLSVAVGRR